MCWIQMAVKNSCWQLKILFLTICNSVVHVNHNPWWVIWGNANLNCWYWWNHNRALIQQIFKSDCYAQVWMVSFAKSEIFELVLIKMYYPMSLLIHFLTRRRLGLVHSTDTVQFYSLGIFSYRLIFLNDVCLQLPFAMFL